MPTSFELHMQEIKDARKNFKHLRGNKDTTEYVIRKIYEFIYKLFIKIIVVVIVKAKFFDMYQPQKLLDWALRLLIERINRYAYSESKIDKEFVFLILDEDFTHDKKKRKFISEMMELGIIYNTQDADRVLDTPIFLKSELHNGIQIVDSVAFLIHRYTRKKIEGIGNTLFHEICDELISDLKWKFCGGAPSKNNESGLKFFPSTYTTLSEYWEAFSD